MRARLLIALTLACTGFFAVSRACADDDPFGEPASISLGASAQGDPVTAKIRETLGHPTDIDFVETPLSEALQFLEDYHKIQIQVDHKAFDEMGIASDIPITHNVKGVTLRSALKLVLRPLGLTYVIKDEVLLITTKDAGQDLLDTRIYPVLDLVILKDGRIYYGPLLHMINHAIEPDSWDVAGGPGFITDFRGSLVISQTEEVHEQIEDLLRILRAPEVKKARDAAPDPVLLEAERAAPAANQDAPATESQESSERASRRSGGFF